MSLLPPPFQSSGKSSERFQTPSFLTNSELANTSHFPPWYSGSESSKLHQHLSQNRAVQIGVPPTWKSAGPTDPGECDDWPTSRKPIIGSPNFRKFNNSNNVVKKSYYCDVCNRGFGDQDELSDHQATHVKCPFASCNFKAHPKVVTLHQKLQHSSGLADKLICLDTPEGIRKWREERKRNFPTAANIERKKKEEAEMLARGEELRNKFFGKMRQGNVALRKGGAQTEEQNGQRGRGRGRRRHRKRSAAAMLGPAAASQAQVATSHKQANTSQPSVTDESAVATHRVGNNAVGDCNGDSTEKHASESEEESRLAKPPSPLAVRAIGGSISLLAGYGSGSDSNQEEEKACKAQRWTYLPAKPIPDLYPTNKNRHHSRTGRSLLEKLLANEIRHERNVVLQCVHYTVKKNFFCDK